jgi:hypothetical protein
MSGNPAGSCHNDGTLSHGYVPGIHKANILCVRLVFNGQLAAVIGAGGDCGISQIQHLCLGIRLEDIFQDFLKVIGSAAAGGGGFTGANVVEMDIFSRESAVVQGHISQCNMHGNKTDAQVFGKVSGDIGAGFSQQDDRGHRNSP